MSQLVILAMFPLHGHDNIQKGVRRHIHSMYILVVLRVIIKGKYTYPRAVFLKKNDWGGGGGGGRTHITWPKATARGRVREGSVPPPARSVKLKLPSFYKVNGKVHYS